MYGKGKMYEGKIKVFRIITKGRVFGTHRNQKTLQRIRTDDEESKG